MRTVVSHSAVVKKENCQPAKLNHVSLWPIRRSVVDMQELFRQSVVLFLGSTVAMVTPETTVVAVGTGCQQGRQQHRLQRTYCSNGRLTPITKSKRWCQRPALSGFIYTSFTYHVCYIACARIDLNTSFSPIHYLSFSQHHSTKLSTKSVKLSKICWMQNVPKN